MSLDHFSAFFSRFNNLTLPNETVRRLVCDFVVKKTNITISLKEVDVKGDRVYIQVKPALKNELFMYKEELVVFLENNTKKRYTIQ